MTVKAPINPKVLFWARKQSGFNIEEVVTKINLKRVSKETIEKWEKGTDSPLFSDLEKIADIYKRPSALFFFDEPPQESIEKDFRGLESYISPSTRYLIRKAKLLQLNLKELTEGLNPAKKSNNYLLSKIEPSDSVEKMIISVRNELDIDLKKQKSWKDSDIALKKWRESLESKGIFIFKDAFKDKGEYKKDGFCIYDKEFPIIYLNNSISKNRQIFTLFHELAHLIKKKNGVNFRAQKINFYNPEEIFCNQFAGNFLIPSIVLNETFREDRNINEQSISNLANTYNVSPEVICRRLLDNHKINQKEYIIYIEKFKTDKIKKNDNQGGDYVNNMKTYLGKTYIDLALGRYRSGKISRTQYAEYLGVKIRTVDYFE